jgi:hypothetical protein
MQQRQLRLGDILDDYCPRERRVTNHAVVAMVGQDVKQTRCTTCDAEHEYKHAKVPRQRRKADTQAVLYSQVLAKGPKRVVHDDLPADGAERVDQNDLPPEIPPVDVGRLASDDAGEPGAALDLAVAAVNPVNPVNPVNIDAVIAPAMNANETPGPEPDEGPVHRPLIRASLPRPDGQPPPTRPIPEFTIRQPAGRTNRFRPRNQRGGQPFPGSRPGGNMAGGSSRGGMRSSGGRPPLSHTAKRQGHGRKRSK